MRSVKFSYEGQIYEPEVFINKFKSLSIIEPDNYEIDISDEPPLDNTQLTIVIERIFMAAHFMALITFTSDGNSFNTLDYQHLSIVDDICKSFGPCKCIIGSGKDTILVNYYNISHLQGLLKNQEIVAKTINEEMYISKLI